MSCYDLKLNDAFDKTTILISRVFMRDYMDVETGTKIPSKLLAQANEQLSMSR